MHGDLAWIHWMMVIAAAAPYAAGALVFALVASWLIVRRRS